MEHAKDGTAIPSRNPLSRGKDIIIKNQSKYLRVNVLGSQSSKSRERHYHEERTAMSYEQWEAGRNPLSRGKDIIIPEYYGYETDQEYDDVAIL